MTALWRCQDTLAFRKIQFHADPVGIVEEKLRVACARHDAFAELDVSGLKALAHALDIARRERDVIEPAGMLEFLLGAADDNALSWLARAHQMNGSHAPRVEPIAGKIEWRPIAVLEAKHLAIKILGALEIRRFDRVMLKYAQRHVALLRF